MSYALLFSGQGGQHPEMLPWLERDAQVHAVEAAVGADWRAMLADRGWAGRNAVAQPLLTGLALAAWEQIAPLLPAPAAIAGYSVGELAAFSAAGIFSPATAIALARRRAAVMDESAAATPTGMLGVTGLAPDSVAEVCGEFGLVVAIRIGVDSAVLGGPRNVLRQAEAAAADRGGHGTVLNVSLASHVPWLGSAAQAFAAELAATSFEQPRCLLFSNARGAPVAGQGLRPALAAQISSTVLWDACMEGISERQVACALEVGPGQALARIWNQRYPSVPARSVDEFRSRHAVATWVRRQTDG